MSELSAVEDRLPGLFFTKEDSSLAQLNRSFPDFLGRPFEDWVRILAARKGGSILEVGGGPNQVAAREIMARYPGAHFTAIERRPLSDEAAADLSGHLDNFRYHQAGFSEAGDLLDENAYRLIFAHNVVEHLPNPFYFVEEAHNRYLRLGGLLFVNNIPVYQDVWEKVRDHLEKREYRLNWSTTMPESVKAKKGIISVNLAMERAMPVSFPVREGDRFMTDFYGHPMATREFFYQNPQS